MSYAIIRNEKYTKEKVIQISPHNERVKNEYSNKNIDVSKTHLNYHLKKPKENNYLKEFKRLKEQNNLKGQLHKNSIYACEVVVTSDNTFFKKIGFKETQKYFKTAYDFICNYKNLGEENIISAVVHLDEETPHLHLTFIPVVDSRDKKGNPIRKICGSEFWEEKNSYMLLQDRFYEYIREKGFNLDRGKNLDKIGHFRIEDLKEITNFYKTKKLEKELNTQNISTAKYVTIKDFLENEQFTPKSVDNNLLQPLLQENIRLLKEINNLKIAKIENIIKNSKEIEIQNSNLLQKIRLQSKELNVMYNLISKLNKKM